jgi:recombination protein RecA
MYCQKEYQPKRSTSVYCSNACRRDANRQKEPSTPIKDTLTPPKINRINTLLAERNLPPIIRGSDLPPVDFISSGIKEIDALAGGFPRKRVTEVFGLKGVGKTALMTRIINSTPNLKVFYVDAENALIQVPDNIEVFNEFILERVEEAVEVALQANYDLIVVDSVASLVPWAEVEGDAGDAHMGLKARLMSQWMRRINFHLSKSTAALVFINQQRETLSQWGSSKFTPGGFALGFASSLRIELKSNKADKKENYQLVTAVVEKSRFSKPYEKAEFKLVYKT